MITREPARELDWGARWRTPEEETRLEESVDYCWRFFVGQADAQRACAKLVRILEAEGVPYAIIGALALNEYGHKRVTVDVDLVMRDEDLQAFKSRWLGRGYAERVPGTGKLLDTEFSVHVDVLSTGRFPGDDKPKPIAFLKNYELPKTTSCSLKLELSQPKPKLPSSKPNLVDCKPKCPT